MGGCVWKLPLLPVEGCVWGEGLCGICCSIMQAVFNVKTQPSPVCIFQPLG